MQTITYQEAANLLGCTKGTIENAVSRKVLSKAPSSTKEQKLIKEQVMLFKGKQLRKSMLSENEVYWWEKYKASVETQTVNRVEKIGLEGVVEKFSGDLTTEEAEKWLEMGRLLKALQSLGKEGEVPQGSPLILGVSPLILQV